MSLLKLLRDLEFNDIALFSKDRAGRYLSMNRPGAKMLGHAPKDVIRKMDDELFESSSSELMKRRDELILRSTKFTTYDSLARTKNGWTLFHSSKMPVKNEFGNSIGLIGFSTDISLGRSSLKSELLKETLQAIGTRPFEFYSFLEATEGMHESLPANSLTSIQSSEFFN